MEQDEIEHSSNHTDPSDTNSAHGRMNTNDEMQADQKTKKQPSIVWLVDQYSICLLPRCLSTQ